MKKSLITLLIIAMLACIGLVSCKNEVQVPAEELVSVSFENESSRALTASIEEFKPETYYWKYAAKKADSSNLVSGQTAYYDTNPEADARWIEQGQKGFGTKSESGLYTPFQVQGFSQGLWDFTLFAYNDVDGTQLVYSGEAKAVLIQKGGNHTVSAVVSPAGSGSGTLNVLVEEIKLDAAAGAQVVANARIKLGIKTYGSETYDIKALDFVTENYSEPVGKGQYHVDIQFTNDDGLVVYASGSVIATVYSGLTTTVSGSLSEALSYAEFAATSDVIATTIGTNPEDPITQGTTQTSVNFTSTTDDRVTASMPTSAAKSLIAEMEQALDAKTSTETSQTSELTLNLSVNTTDVTETKVTYEIGMDATLKYQKKDQTGTESTTTTSAVKNLDDYVTVDIDIDSDVSDVTVKHSGVAMRKFDDTAEGYEAFVNAALGSDALIDPLAPEEGYKGFYCLRTVGDTKTLYIKTRSFSPFEVSYEMTNYVAAIGTAKYTSLADAAEKATEGQTIVLLDDITFDEDYSVVVWEKAFNLDLNGHTITTNSEVGWDLSNNGYKASAICFSIEETGSQHAVVVSNGTINTRYGAGIYADGDELNLTIKNVSIHQNHEDYEQTTDEYSSAVRLTSGAKVTIESGTFEGMHAVAVSNSGGDVRISGGTFKSDLFLSASTNPGVSKSITITGGTFYTDPSAYVAEGLIAIKDGDKWIIEENFPGSGTEEHPFRIKDEDAWMKLVRLCKSDSTYASTAGKYFEIEKDIDASKYTVDACVQYFGGHIDFTNHTFSGFDATSGNSGKLFVNVGGESASIENLTLETTTINYASGTVWAFSLCDCLYGNVTIKNVSIIGSASGINTNNNGLFAQYVGYGNGGYGHAYDYIFENCNNYANLTGTVYTAAFIGAGGFGNGGRIVFRNCKNYGTILSLGLSASMLHSNCTYFTPIWGSSLTQVVIEGCENFGNIAGAHADTQYSTLFTNPNIGDGVFFSQNAVLNGTRLDDGTGSFPGLAAGKEKINTAAGDSLKGSQPANVTAVALGTENNCFVLNPTAGATKYELAFSFASANRNGGGAGYTLSFTGDSLPGDIMVGSWITKSEAEASAEEIVEHNEYGTTYYTCGGSYVYYEEGARFHGANRVINVFFVAYDDDNNVKSIATYTYPVVPNNN